MATAAERRPDASEPLKQPERDALEAWRRWGIAPEQELLERAMAKVAVQLPLAGVQRTTP